MTNSVYIKMKGEELRSIVRDSILYRALYNLRELNCRRSRNMDKTNQKWDPGNPFHRTVFENEYIYFRVVAC